jgi:hypothetical protein
MLTNQRISIEDEVLLAEIFITPSLVLVENRFANPSNAADCSGKCDSGGGCRAI